MSNIDMTRNLIKAIARHKKAKKKKMELLEPDKEGASLAEQKEYHKEFGYWLRVEHEALDTIYSTAQKLWKLMENE